MKKRHTEKQIVIKLRDIDILLDQGKTVGEACRKFEITEQTYYRWRQKYGGMTPEMVKQFKEIEKENTRLRKIVADQRIDIEILDEANKILKNM